MIAYPLIYIDFNGYGSSLNTKNSTGKDFDKHSNNLSSLKIIIFNKFNLTKSCLFARYLWNNHFLDRFAAILPRE